MVVVVVVKRAREHLSEEDTAVEKSVSASSSTHIQSSRTGSCHEGDTSTYRKLSDNSDGLNRPPARPSAQSSSADQPVSGFSEIVSNTLLS